MSTPSIIARTKSFVVTPPKKYNAAKVKKVVKDVLILLVNVWLTEESTISPNVIFLP